MSDFHDDFYDDDTKEEPKKPVPVGETIYFCPVCGPVPTGIDERFGQTGRVIETTEGGEGLVCTCDECEMMFYVYDGPYSNEYGSPSA